MDPYAPPDRAVTLRTARLETLRAVPYGYLQACTSAFFIYVVLRRYEMGALAKSLVVASPYVGLLASPWVVTLARRRRLRAMAVASALMAVGGVALLAAAAVDRGPALVAGALVALACSDATIPLLTTVHHDNWRAHERGRFLARSLVVRVACSAGAGVVVGSLLRRDIAWSRAVVVVAAAACLACAACFRLLPSRRLGEEEHGAHDRLFPNFGLLGTDRLLRVTLSAWMLMGLGNLMMAPLGIEYLANPEFGIGADAGRVAALTVTVPSVVRLFFSPVFGWIFDRMSFFTTRVALNLIFVVGTLAFFTGKSAPGLYVGAAIYGLAVAGGDVMWSLWVVKFAPPVHVADYMALHTFTTGLRGLVSAFVAFQLVRAIPILAIGSIAMAMMIVSAAMLVPEARAERLARRSGSAAAI